MAWETVLEKDQIEVRCDKTNKNIVIEVSSSGLQAQYVTLYLDEIETKELINSLKIANDKVFSSNL